MEKGRYVYEVITTAQAPAAWIITALAVVLVFSLCLAISDQLIRDDQQMCPVVDTQITDRSPERKHYRQYRSPIRDTMRRRLYSTAEETRAAQCHH